MVKKFQEVINWLINDNKHIKISMFSEKKKVKIIQIGKWYLKITEISIGTLQFLYPLYQIFQFFTIHYFIGKTRERLTRDFTLKLFCLKS